MKRRYRRRAMRRSASVSPEQKKNYMAGSVAHCRLLTVAGVGMLMFSGTGAAQAQFSFPTPAPNLPELTGAVIPVPVFTSAFRGALAAMPEETAPEPEAPSSLTATRLAVMQAERDVLDELPAETKRVEGKKGRKEAKKTGDGKQETGEKSRSLKTPSVKTTTASKFPASKAATETTVKTTASPAKETPIADAAAEARGAEDSEYGITTKELLGDLPVTPANLLAVFSEPDRSLELHVPAALRPSGMPSHISSTRPVESPKPATIQPDAPDTKTQSAPKTVDSATVNASSAAVTASDFWKAQAGTGTGIASPAPSDASSGIASGSTTATPNTTGESAGGATPVLGGQNPAPLAPTVPLTAQATAPPDTPPADPNAMRIGAIEVRGNKNLNTPFIILSSGHKVGDVLTQSTLDEIQLNIYRLGYFGWRSGQPEEAVRVIAEEDNRLPPRQLRIVIEVEENDLIKQVSITGSGPIKPEEIRPLIKINEQTGTVYNGGTLVRDFQAIQDLYNQRGYIVTPGTDLGPDDKNPSILNVPLVVTRVSEITLVKNRKTRRNVILREMRTKEGDYYNRETFLKDRIRLINLDLFEEVTPQERNLGPGRIGLTLNVPEKRTGTVSVGLGYSNRSQIVGRAEITETNFRGLGETVNVLAETGGITGRSTLEVGFTEPYLDRKHTSATLQLYSKNIYRFANSLNGSVVNSNINSTTGNLGDRYNEQRRGGTLTVSRPIRDTVRAALSLRAEDVHTDPVNLPINSLRIIQEGPIFSFGASALHNTRDLDVDPVKGGFQSLSAEVGYADLRQPRTINNIIVPGQYGGSNFFKTQLDARQFFPIFGARRRDRPDEDKTTLAFRGLLGTSAGRLPFFEQFFVGGAESLRGYREDRFWGKNMFLASIELRQPLARRLKGVLFLDIGHAWGGAFQDVNIAGFRQTNFSPHFGIGPGIRVVTPLGPIRLDYGFGSEGARAHFSIGNSF